MMSLFDSLIALIVLLAQIGTGFLAVCLAIMTYGFIVAAIEDTEPN